MTRSLTSMTWLVAVGLLGCGDPGSSAATAANQKVREILAIEGNARHEAACDILSSGVVADTFAVDSTAVRYHPLGITRVPHAHCSASWDKPDKDAIEAAYKEQMLAYGQSKARAMMKREPFDEPMPKPVQSTYSASLTITSPVYDSREAAVAGLKSRVQTLADGIDFEVQGRQHTVQIEYDQWLDDIGDGAAWSSRNSQMAVADNGVVFYVTASGLGSADENKSKARELAVKLAGRIAGK